MRAEAISFFVGFVLMRMEDKHLSMAFGFEAKRDAE